MHLSFVSYFFCTFQFAHEIIAKFSSNHTITVKSFVYLYQIYKLLASDYRFHALVDDIIEMYNRQK